MLRAAGRHLGSLAGRDLAARCAEGRLDVRGKAESRAWRKRALTGDSSSRWAGAITRTSEDQHRLAGQNLEAEAASLRARIRKIEERLTIPVGGRSGKTRGYATPAERHAKDIRLRSLRARLARVERRLAAGSVPVTRGGRALLRKRANLVVARLTEQEWRAEWDAARLFLTADGEKDSLWGNQTIRFNPDEGWVEIKLPAPLSNLANRPHGRYRLSCPVKFTYRGDEVAAQAATAAIRYDITLHPTSGRWYLDARWKTSPRSIPALEELRSHPVVAVDVNAFHLAVAVIAADGNVLGTPVTVPLDLAGLPASARDGRLRGAISGLIATARRHGARAVVIEDLDFAQARAEGRERTGGRPSRGRRGRAFRRAVTGIPTGRFRDRLVQMTANAGLHVVVIDPAYTSRWGTQHWLAPLREHHPETTGPHAAALVTGRRGLGHRARRRATGNRTAPEDAARPAQARPRKTPVAGSAPRKPVTPRGPRQPLGTKTGPPHRTTTGYQAAQDRAGPPDSQDQLLISRLETVRTVWIPGRARRGQFGVVTSLVFATVPEPRATRFELRWPGREAAGVVAAWQDWAPGAPDDITANLAVTAEPGHGVRAVVFGAALRAPEATRALLAGILPPASAPPAARCEVMTWRDLKRSFAAPGPGGPVTTASRSEFFARPLPAAAVSALVDGLVTGSPPGPRELNFTAMGGAYSRVPADATAFAHRGARFLLEHAGRDGDPWIGRSWAVAHPHASGGVYPNFPDPALGDWAAAYHGGNLERLRAVRRAYDPDRLLRFPQAL